MKKLLLVALFAVAFVATACHKNEAAPAADAAAPAADGAAPAAVSPAAK